MLNQLTLIVIYAHKSMNKNRYMICLNNFAYNDKTGLSSAMVQKEESQAGFIERLVKGNLISGNFEARKSCYRKIKSNEF